MLRCAPMPASWYEGCSCCLCDPSCKAACGHTGQSRLVVRGLGLKVHAGAFVAGAQEATRELAEAQAALSAAEVTCRAGPCSLALLGRCSQAPGDHAVHALHVLLHAALAAPHQAMLYLLRPLCRWTSSCCRTGSTHWGRCVPKLGWPCSLVHTPVSIVSMRRLWVLSLIS